MGAATPPTRRDAVRNRARIVDAAARAFRTRGLDVSVNEIARDAGVNVATLYRHFPSKKELVGGVLEAILEPLVDARDRALVDDRGRGVLAAFLQDAARMQARHHGLVDALVRHPDGVDVRKLLRKSALEIVAPLVGRAHDEGELRPDLGARDLLIVLRMVVAAASAQGIRGQDVDRYVDVVVRGLRPD